jgi:hypothetical protein
MTQNPTPEVKYCVAAFLDLQGFSHHLEVSSDIRTTIGQEAIRRLQTLEHNVEFLRQEQERMSFVFPYKRMNDAIIFTIDLSDALLPNVGDTYKAGLTEDEWEKLYDIKPMRLDKVPIDLGDSSETFDEKYERKRKEYTLPLLKFLGLVSRIHQRVAIEESHNNFPGSKTIITTGFRRRFLESDGSEDCFSANFAFSNSYKAAELLKGAGLFLDNHILKMMDADLRTKNIAKLACLSYNRPVYSPLKLGNKTEDVFIESRVEKVSLFRKTYYFRNVNANPLTYLQFVDDLEARNDMHDFIVKNIKEENIDEKIKNGDHFNILKLPYDMGKEVYERFARELDERYPPVTIHCFGCGGAVEAEWKVCNQCGVDLLNFEQDA